MREAAVPGYRLSKARSSTRVLITLGLIGLLLGLLSSVGVTISRTGISAAHVQAYYLGSSNTSELGGLLSEMAPRSFAEMFEVTHLHLLGGSMLLFFLCHLLSLCELSERTRNALYIISFASFLLTFTLPWLIIYLHPAFAWCFGPCVIVSLLSLIVVSLLPLREMWFSS